MIKEIVIESKNFDGIESSIKSNEGIKIKI
jgi:hypothetical protein